MAINAGSPGSGAFGSPSLAVSFQEVVHSVWTVDADVAKLQ
jgi:hypothetical protein